MTNETKDGGPAFPSVNGTFHQGMTMRDWFAGMALQGYFAAPYTPHLNAANKETAEYCYEIADAMLKARGK